MGAIINTTHFAVRLNVFSYRFVYLWQEIMRFYLAIVIVHDLELQV